MKNLQNYFEKLYKEKSLNLFDIIIIRFLELLSILYAIVLKIRESLYNSGYLKTTKIDIPVLSIGNITMGGTGKTSLCISLTRILQNKISDIAILSRGYKSKNKKTWALVSDGNKIMLSPEEAGDEPYLLAKKFPGIKVLIGKNRAFTALIAQCKFNARLIILDDGFQQRKLRAKINIVLIDAKCPFGNYKLFPCGILRQSLDVLKKCNIIIITNVNMVDEYKFLIDKIQDINPEIDIFTAQYRLVKIKSLLGDNSINIEEIRKKSVLVVSGIAHPEYFKQTVQKFLNMEVKSIYYPDHYHYNIKDFKEIEKKALEYGCEIILITEKDAVKFIPLSIPVYIVESEMKVNEEDKFREKISEFIALS
ncbi:MAG: tetraacyldisaccharide 4'-kinase [Candidatus Firestonebacteria bacterium]|nr:tetraacyldisaccharide 4'-kinase [Candidatus Firestonebacteria bacterium]